MSERNKNRKSKLKDFLRYRRNEMTGEERNAFERELQRDPFAEEASEAFSQITAEDTETDISALQKRLDNRVSRRSPVVFYRIAASVAVLMVISALFIVTRRKDQVPVLSENIRQEQKSPISVPVPELSVVQVVKEPDRKKDIPPSPEKVITAELPADKKGTDQQVEELTVAESESEISKESEVIKPDLAVITADKAEPRSVVAEKRMDMAHAAGVPANAKSVALRDYKPPQPVIGMDSFDLYLEKNIQKPEPDKSEQQVVIVSFKVRIDSVITNIRIINTPGQPYSSEAIRLIKEGPAWKPAEDRGKPVEDEVSVRIVFR